MKNADCIFEIVLRSIIAFVFILAAVGKIAAPDVFVSDLKDYQLLPESMVNFFAVYLPWMELLAALFLLINYKTRGALIVVTGLLFVFIIALSINLLRGASFECGCFGRFFTQSIWQALLKNVFLITGALFLLIRKLINTES